MLNKLSNIIANYLIILSNTDTDDAQKDVYAYGIECFLNTAITVSILCLWGMITHTFSETVIWLISFTLLRHYVGGYHAPSNLSCILSSVLLGASNYFIPNFLLNEFLTLCLYSFLLVICWFFAPVKNYQKKLLAKGRFYYKFHSLFLLFADRQDMEEMLVGVSSYQKVINLPRHYENLAIYVSA